MATEAQSLIGTLHSRGWTDSAIGRAVGRDSSLIHQGSTGKKPLANALDSLREMVASGANGPKSSKSPTFTPSTMPTPRVRASGQPAAVRQSREEQAARAADRRHEAAIRGARHTGKGELASATALPNGQKTIAGHTVASARLASAVADGMSGNARVKVTYRGVDGKWHTLGSKGGFSPEVIYGMLKGRRTGSSLAGVLGEMVGRFYKGGTAPDASGEAEFYVVTI